jgi:CO/xanthine dehydrogenase Mo-binding subunit
VIDGEECPVLADREIRYAGEPVALLAGATQRELVTAARQLEIEFHEHRPAFDFESADSATVASEHRAVRGKPDKVRAAGGELVEGYYRTGIREHLYNEPNGAVVEPTENGLIVRTATQWPYHVRETVASTLAMQPEDVVVHPTDPGVTLDGKLWYPSLTATHCALLAHATGTPVKLVYSNTEDFCFTTKRAPFAISVSTALAKDGGLAAAQIDIRYNAGAYPLFTKEMARRLIGTAASQYECANLGVTVQTIRTNLPPLNVLGGFGESSLQFAIESHIDRVAEVTGSDPIDWRIRHLAASPKARGRKQAAVGQRCERVLELVAKRSDFRRKHGAYALQRERREDEDVRRPAGGIGVSLGMFGSGFTVPLETSLGSTVTVRLDADGSAALRTSSIADAHVADNWRARIADTLGLEPDNVSIESDDTSVAPDSGPSTLSRDLVIVTQLVEQACATIQRRRFRSPLPIEVRKSFRQPRSAGFDYEKLEGIPFPSAAIGAAVVEVSMDPVTFESTVSNVWSVVDPGEIIDGAEARRAMEMSIYQALEWAMHEQISFRAGVIDPRTYLSYRNIADADFPAVSVEVVETAGQGSHGISDLPQSIVPAALAAAVSQATGRYMDRIPTNPALIHDYLEIE